MKKTIIIFVAAVIAAIAIRYGITALNNYKTGMRQAKRPAPAVTVQPVQEADIIRNFEAPGRVTSKYQVNVLARISGYLQKIILKKVIL